MPRNPRKQHCTHPGCRAWAKRGYHLCVRHLDPAMLPLLASPLSPAAPSPPAQPPPPQTEAASPAPDQDALQLFVAMCETGFPAYSIPVLAQEQVRRAKGKSQRPVLHEHKSRLFEVEAETVIQHFFARCIEICDFAIRQMRAEVGAGRMDPLYAAEQSTRIGAHLSRILAAGHAVRAARSEGLSPILMRSLELMDEAERAKWEAADPATRGPLPDRLLTPEEMRERRIAEALKQGPVAQAALFPVAPQGKTPGER